MPDNITFKTIPTDWRVPGAWLEISNDRAVRGLSNMPHKILLLGQRLATGSVAKAVLKRVTRPADGVDYFGRGSQLAQIVAAALKVNKVTETWALALDDLEAGNKAVGSIAITGTATETTTIYVYVGTGVDLRGRVPVAIAANDSAATVATAIAAAINADKDAAVTATADAGTVTVTARHKGECGNDIDIRIGYYQGEKTNVAGLNVVMTPMAGGTGNPDVLEAIAAMSSGAFYTIVMPWTDTANVTLMETELESRWGGLDMRAGHSFGFISGTFDQAGTFGDARNSKHNSFPALKKCPTLPWVIAAQFAACVEFSGANDPAIPFRDIVLPDVLAPAEADRFTDTERNLLLHDGISTIKFGPDGTAMVEMVITTYKTDAFGLEDISVLKLNTKWTSDYHRYMFRADIARTFPNHKLAGDDVLPYIKPGQRIATPKLIEACLIGTAMKLRAVGLLEDLDQFKRDVMALRSEVDPDRVNSIIPPNLVNQFEVFAGVVQYIL